MTQTQQVKQIMQDKQQMTIKEVAHESWIKEPNIRRILWQGTKQGIFRRLAEWVYMIQIWDSTKALINVWDAIESIKTLRENNYKFDMVFLDIPYNTPAVKWWNRWVKYDLISPEQFKSFLNDLKYCIHDNTDVYHMYSQAPSGWKEMQKYNNIFEELWFKHIKKWERQKLYKNWKKALNVQWKEAKPEWISLYNLSWTEKPNIQLDYETVRLRIASEKPMSMLSQLVKQSTNPWDIILDPFAWTGSTGESALINDRNIVLIEKSTERVHQEILPRLQSLFC